MSEVPFSTLSSDYLNRVEQLLQQRPPRPPFDLSRFKFEDSNLGHIEDEIEEEEEEEETEDEEIMEEDEEESVNDSIIEEEEDISENMETRMEIVEYDIHLINQGYQQTSGRQSRTARMRVNTNYIHYTIQVPQSILDDTYSDEIEDEEEEEEMVEEEDINELIVDEDMSEYFETSTCYVPPTMDIDEEQEACAICLLEYKDEDTIATLQCGHEFHVECINKWLHRKKTCPFCRASVLPHN